MEGFVSVISIIFGVLSVILFFKVWDMCDNVRRICKTVYGIKKTEDVETAFRFLLSIGEKDKAKEILINRILSNDAIFDSKLPMSHKEKIDSIFSSYGEELEALGVKMPQIEIKE